MQTKKHYKKGNRKTKNRRNKNKKTKKQKGGFICQQPNVIERQSSYLNKAEDLRVNTENYMKYLEECELYSKCYFTNINNLNLLTEILSIFKKNIGNALIEFTYKKIPNTETTKFSDYDNVNRSLNNNPINENVSLNTSKFLDIYLTKLYLEYYASYYTTNCKTDLGYCDLSGVPLNNNILLSDLNTVFLDNESKEFIIENGEKILKNKIITFFINLDNKFLLRSILQILSTTLANVYQDRILIYNAVVSLIGFQTDIIANSGGNANAIAAQMVIEFILKIFVFNFAKYIENYETQEELLTDSIHILKLIYKLLYSIVYSPINSYKIKNLIENSIPKIITIGESPYIKITDLPIFAIINNINVINCIIKSLLENNRFNIICSEIEEYLTLGTSFNNLSNKNFLLAGCKTTIGKSLGSWELWKLGWNYLFP